MSLTGDRRAKDLAAVADLNANDDVDINADDKEVNAEPL